MRFWKSPRASPERSREKRAFLLGALTTFVVAVAATLAAERISSLLAGPSVPERLREISQAAHDDGRYVLAQRRLAMVGPGIFARVLLLRARDPSRSDRIEIYNEDGDSLSQVFADEPTPEPPSVSEPTYPSFLNVYAEGGAPPQRPTGRRLSLLAVTDLTGDRNPDLLLTLSPQLYLKQIPLILTFDQVSARYRLLPVLTSDFQVGAPERLDGAFALQDLQLRRYLYQGPVETIASQTGAPPLRSRAAAAFALLRERGDLYLLAAFALNVRFHWVAPPIDTYCIPERHLRALLEASVLPPCGAAGGGVERHSTLFNLKAWRFPRLGAAPFSEDCSGTRTLFRTGGDPGLALRRNWSRYISRERAC